MTTNFVEESYFKSGMEAFERSHDWKSSEALAPELVE